MIGGSGMSGCTQFGFEYIKTEPGKLKIYYFELANSKEDNYENVLKCNILLIFFFLKKFLIPMLDGLYKNSLKSTGACGSMVNTWISKKYPLFAMFQTKKLFCFQKIKSNGR